MLRLAGAALALLLGVGKGTAHDLWISPATYRWPAGETVLADLRTGAAFEGTAHGVAPDGFERFEILIGDDAVAVEGRVGDIPAIGGRDLPEGLAVILHQTLLREETLEDWGRLTALVDPEAPDDLQAMKAARGPGRTGLLRAETVRCAKSLVAVGHGAGADRVAGMRTELVALANPYTDDLAGAIPVQLYLDGTPRPMARVEVFARPADGAEGRTEATEYETDSNGIVVLPIRPGMEYLVSAVTLDPTAAAPDAPANAEGPGWRTLWASLTFEVPRPDVTP